MELGIGDNLDSAQHNDAAIADTSGSVEGWQRAMFSVEMLFEDDELVFLPSLDDFQQAC